MEETRNVDESSLRWMAEEVLPHDSSLKAYLRGSFPTVRDIDDVVQESYLRLLKANASERIRAAKPFLFRIARNLALDLLRRDRSLAIDAMPDLASVAVSQEGKSVPGMAAASEEAALLAEALDALPARCRQIIVLRKFRNIPQKEVADMLGISELTVQEQVYRGLRRCAKFLAARGMIRPIDHG